VGANFFHADGRTDRQTEMTQQIVAFRNWLMRQTLAICFESNLSLEDILHNVAAATYTSLIHYNGTYYENLGPF
jgi:hypothetical protein